MLATCIYASFSRSGVAQAQKANSATSAGTKKPVTTKPIVADQDLPTVVDDKFTIEVSSKTAKFEGGQPIQVDITLKNNGESTPSTSDSPVEIFFDIEVTSPYERSHPPLMPSLNSRRYGGSSRVFNFGNGYTLSGWIMLSNIYDMSIAGTYTVTVSKRFRYQDARKGLVVIRSHPFTIDVPRDAPVSSWYSTEEKH